MDSRHDNKIVIMMDSQEENALFDALLHSEYDERLDAVYEKIGLFPDENKMMVMF